MARDGYNHNRNRLFFTGPRGNPVECQVYLWKGRIYRAEYRPNEVGSHKVDVIYNDLAIPGSPFVCEVYDVSKIRVHAADDGVVGQTLNFKVDTSQAGYGNIEPEMKARGHDVPLRKLNQGSGIYMLTFTPQEPVRTKLYLTFNGHPEARPSKGSVGSPFEVHVKDFAMQQTHLGLTHEPGHVVASGRGLKGGRVGDRLWFVAEVHTAEGQLETFITAPNGSHIQARQSKQKDGDYKIDWSPTVPGRYQIDVMQSGRAIMGSPFYAEVYDPSRVVIEEVTQAMVAHEAGFKVIYVDAGRADLLVTITSPSGGNLPFDIHEGSGFTYISYVAQEPGKHRVVITYGGDDVPRSPLTVLADEAQAGMVIATGDGLYRCLVDEEAHFTVRGLKDQPVVRVDGPNSIAKVTVRPVPEQGWKIFYTPVEVGIFNIKIFGNGREITGSPYHPKVTDPRRVKVVGGWHSIMDANNRLYLKVGEEKRIQFDITEAGPGEIMADVDGPHDQVPVAVEKPSDTRRRVCFTPPIEGHYELSLFWNKVPLPKSPMEGYATLSSPSRSPVSPSKGSMTRHVVESSSMTTKHISGTEGNTKVILRGRGLQEAKTKQEAEFIIDGSHCAPGRPVASIQSTSKSGFGIPVDVEQIDNNVYRCVYVINTPGAYLLNIMWGDRHVSGSPFKVSVTGSLCDPNKVTLSGEGLKGGVIGRDLVSKIDTRRAGPGELTAHCVGPQKVAYCELFDHRDGTYTLNIRPQEAGKHTLHVKYDGENVPGSPFVLRVAGAPDASKVKVYGPGIEDGVLALYQSRFICETRGAGAGQLTVRIRGPKGAFRVEMQRESQKDRTILCKYDPTEPGEYFVHVKWSGVDVPGSPFKVCIFDTQDELERYRRGGWVPTWGPVEPQHGGSLYSPVYRPAIPWGQDM
ncbi:PREDICTED: filamin-B-like [Priapulus caudatus]|uniref:Filamin-B-like n=1 Tax=Priapulus caudatus TaxID=37621 RepID=A0ABM1E9P1_PRICU|nr:PREDICTED: filamin-B-like [Priapulus caudatus]